MKTKEIKLVFIALLAIIASGCASLTGFEEGRTVGKGRSEITPSINYSRSPNLFGDIEELDLLQGFPNIEMSYKYGVGERVDVGVRASTNLNTSVYSKYPAEFITINISPRYTYQFITGLSSFGANFLGGNAGVMFGKKNKFGIDVGYYSVSFRDFVKPFFTVGVGGKFQFGDSESYNSPRRRNRR